MKFLNYIFFYSNFYFYFHQKITTQILQSKTYKNVLYNKLKIKNLKVKIKANRNTNNINQKNNIKNTTLEPLCFFQKKKVNNTNVEKFCTCSYILKICL